MLIYRLRRWPNIKTTSAKRLVLSFPRLVMKSKFYFSPRSFETCAAGRADSTRIVHPFDWQSREIWPIFQSVNGRYGTPEDRQTRQPKIWEFSCSREAGQAPKGINGMVVT